ncbi:MAG: hypothetical protein ABSE73_29755 [Planctomycetota bacterium]
MPEPNVQEQESEEVLRLRRVRQELFGRFKTIDEMFAWIGESEKQSGHRNWIRMAKAQAGKKMKPGARHSKPANRKSVQKA